MKLVQRIGYVVDFLSVNVNNDLARFSFVRQNLLDLIDCTYLSAWNLNDDGNWAPIAESNSCPDLPGAVSDWQLLNKEVAAHHHPQHQPIGCGGYLWSQAVSARTGTTAVAHLCIPDPMNDFVADLADISMRLLLTLKPTGKRLKTAELHGVLTDRQWQILELVAQGKTYGQIAVDLGYSESLVKQEGALICRRLGVESRYQAADYYRKVVQS